MILQMYRVYKAKLFLMFSGTMSDSSKIHTKITEYKSAVIFQLIKRSERASAQSMLILRTAPTGGVS